MRSLLIAGNWKMNGLRSANQALLDGLLQWSSPNRTTEVAVFPCFVHLQEAANTLIESDIHFGAQDISTEVQGARTGEVACDMIRELKCRYVIVGHSERRQYHHESSETIAKKALVALKGGIIPIVCVGESLEQRESGHAEFVIKAQLMPVLDALASEDLSGIVIAYEPVWAIGTGKTASPEQAQAMHAYIRALVKRQDEDAAEKLRILYGGSVKPDNAETLFDQPDIDGALVGGASLNAEDFLSICNTASK